MMSFGKQKVVINNVLLLEINNKGLLAQKKFLDLNNMQKINFSESLTENQFKKNTFVYDFLSTLRQKVNDPLGKRKK